MTTDSTSFDTTQPRNWFAAFSALRRLLSDASDTAQVFQIMRSLNRGSVKAGYSRLLLTATGGRIAYRQVELAQRFSDPAFIAQFAEGSVGAAYRAFLERTGFSAQGLAEVSRTDDPAREAEHPYAWYGRRMRDIHDVWHVLTGYRADDPLGEACLVAFSYAQTGGLGWGFIALGAALKGLRVPGGMKAARAIWEGYRLGRRAAWLPGEDYEELLAQPLGQARRRLRIGKAAAYDAIKHANLFAPEFQLTT